MDFLRSAENFVYDNYPEYVKDFKDMYTYSRQNHGVNISVIRALSLLNLYDEFMTVWVEKSNTIQG